MISIIAVDPGKVTGVAWFTRVKTQERFGSAQVDIDDAANYIRQLACNFYRKLDVPVDIACERFVIGATTARNSPQHDALHLIGSLGDFAANFDWCETRFVLQPAAEAKKVGNKTVLRDLGWWSRLPGGHANDAASHVCLRLLTAHPAVWLGLLNSIEYI